MLEDCKIEDVINSHDEIEEKIENISGNQKVVSELKITDIEPNLEQPRKHFDEEKIEEILSYDWIMVTFRDASKSMYFISPQDEIYWGTSIQVKCPSLLNWYKEQMQN